ncbi:alpha/beta fold hydrolase [Candidatus Bathyarchaeota archaeon]|nr:alpha/beta fold hydrolase [Candidatus Bathyarchaeota archaeon]
MRAGIERTYQVLMTGFIAMMLLSSIIPAAALKTETISRRDLVIDMGGGLITDAQLTFPAVGDGPFPGVLLIPGGGAPDMDEYMPPYSTDTGEPARPHLQIAEYLSERGFAVIRYNKRGVGFNSTLADPGVFFNTTIKDLERDAEKVLEVLMQQSEVDTDDITLLGHSESTIIAPRIAADDPRVKNIVLMGTAGRSYYDIKYFKMVDLRVNLAREILDTDHDGLISIPEVLEGLGPVMPLSATSYKASISANDLIENSTGEWLWRPHWNLDGDEFMNITEEFESTLIRIIEYAMTAEYTGSKLVQSQLALERTMETIGNVSSSVLILHGVNDILTPLEDALLLEQTLTENGHPDHTLITYPGLGHYFYPEDYWGIAMGPTQDYVLHDLEAWLKDPARKVRNLDIQLQTAEGIIEELQGQLDDLNSELDQETSELENQVTELQLDSTDVHNTVAEHERRYMVLQSALDSTKNLTYTALGVALIAVISGAVLMFSARAKA